MTGRFKVQTNQQLAQLPWLSTESLVLRPIYGYLNKLGYKWKRTTLLIPVVSWLKDRHSFYIQVWEIYQKTWTTLNNPFQTAENLSSRKFLSPRKFVRYCVLTNIRQYPIISSRGRVHCIVAFKLQKCLRNKYTFERNSYTYLRNNWTRLRNQYICLRNQYTCLRNQYTCLRNTFTEPLNQKTHPYL